MDSKKALPITTIRTGKGHQNDEGNSAWAHCMAAFHTVQLVEMAPNVFATVVRMLEVPTNEELDLTMNAYPSSLPTWAPWSDRASPVALRGVGSTATQSNHIPEGLLRQNILVHGAERAKAEWSRLMEEQSHRIVEARSLLGQAVLRNQSPLSLSSSDVEVLVDTRNQVVNLERCAAGALPVHCLVVASR